MIVLLLLACTREPPPLELGPIALATAPFAFSQPVRELASFGVPGVRKPSHHEVERCVEGEHDRLPFGYAVVEVHGDRLRVGDRDFAVPAGDEMLAQDLYDALVLMRQANQHSDDVGCAPWGASGDWALAVAPAADASVEVLFKALYTAGQAWDLPLLIVSGTGEGTAPRPAEVETIRVELGPQGAAWEGAGVSAELPPTVGPDRHVLVRASGVSAASLVALHAAVMRAGVLGVSYEVDPSRPASAEAAASSPTGTPTSLRIPFDGAVAVLPLSMPRRVWRSREEYKEMTKEHYAEKEILRRLLEEP